MGTNKKLNALIINNIRCILAIIVCVCICGMVFFAVVYHLLKEPTELIREVGWQSFHLFTILSNLVMAVVAGMCVPFAIDGLRYHNYHLPRWYVAVLFMATCGITITFVVAGTVLSSAVGFYRVMLYKHNVIIHTICPILSILLFIFLNCDHTVKFRSSFIAVIPLMVYAVLYTLMVFVIGEDAGGWRDHYQVYRVVEHLPIPVVLVLVFVIGFVIANLLRLAHNAVHKRRKAALERYYQQADAFSYDDIQSAIEALARIDRQHDMGGELTVPRRILAMMDRKYRSGFSMKDMCNIYVDEYYRTEAKGGGG
ncbi:MAG: hypothetical protein IKH56_05535 [Oscillospiraceae bacterium]|nr:hypothetical protein [Oscillospiraceae bacterium]